MYKALIGNIRKAKDLGREEALKEVLGWLEENFYNIHVLHDDRLKGNFESKEQMLQSFKERFNVVDNCDQQYPSDFINDR